MAAHSTKIKANFDTLAITVSVATGETVAFADSVAPSGAPNTMIAVNWTVLNSEAEAVPFVASYNDLAVPDRAAAIVERALAWDGYGSRLQTAFAAAAVLVAAADAVDAPKEAWDYYQDNPQFGALT